MVISAVTPDRIRSLRQRLGLTQERLANMLGVTWTTVNRWEAGSSSPTGMPARLLILLERAATSPKFQAVLNDPRASDPLFLIHQLLSGVYGVGTRDHVRRRTR